MVCLVLFWCFYWRIAAVQLSATAFLNGWTRHTNLFNYSSCVFEPVLATIREIFPPVLKHLPGSCTVCRLLLMLNCDDCRLALISCMTDMSSNKAVKAIIINSNCVIDHRTLVDSTMIGFCPRTLSKKCCSLTCFIRKAPAGSGGMHVYLYISCSGPLMCIMHAFIHSYCSSCILLFF